MKNYGRFTNISSFSSSVVSNIVKNICPYEAKIYAFWPKMVDYDAGRFLSPIKCSKVKISGNKQFERVLYLASPNASVSMKFEYRKEIIIRRINEYFGQDIIHKIKFINNHHLNLEDEQPIIEPINELATENLLEDDEINKALNSIKLYINRKNNK